MTRLAGIACGPLPRAWIAEFYLPTTALRALSHCPSPDPCISTLTIARSILRTQDSRKNFAGARERSRLMDGADG